MDANNENKIRPGEGNIITLQIPLEIKIDLGNMQVIGDNLFHKGSSGSKFFVQENDIQNVREFDDVNAQLLRTALVKFEESRNSDYYNEDEDHQNRDKYFQPINGSASAPDFYRQLNELVSRTHKTQLKYKPAVHLYPDVDLQPDKTIHSIYSGIEYESEKLILDDFRIDQERGMQLREMMQKRVSWGAEMLAQELDLLESSLPYNCEHVVPQSWFEKREPMRGDLHHLFACEMTCNSFRGNIPYFDFTDFDETTMSKCGRRDGNKFEPSGGKGAVSRAVLYFLLRYPGEINRTSKEYTEDRLEILLGWHKSYPVTEYELHRNAVIFSKQGNRNPFIDFPEFSDKVDFRLGLD